MHDGVRFVPQDDHGPFKFCPDCGEMWRGSAWTLCAIVRTHGGLHTWPQLEVVVDQIGAEAVYRLGGIIALAEFVLDGPQGSPERYRDGWRRGDPRWEIR